MSPRLRRHSETLSLPRIRRGLCLTLRTPLRRRAVRYSVECARRISPPAEDCPKLGHYDVQDHVRVVHIFLVLVLRVDCLNAVIELTLDAARKLPQDFCFQ